MKKILVANRGEIALRILRACREMDIQSVAVYSEPDRTALHVRYADEAYLLGPGPSRDSYLNIPKIIEIAKKSGAEAIHPGYGFLAENAGFAEACESAGIIFIGPTPHSIRLLGDKAQARQTMQEVGIPLVPGTDLVRSAESAHTLASEIGYPVLIKAAGGGGGRGIREVRTSEELENAFHVASDEALQAFGDAGVYIEKYLQSIRHIEVQFIADTFGNVVALGERECSIQRRHQKIIEEAPSTAVDAELRARMMETATKAAQVANYRGAGTVEFLVDQDLNFYFLEVNTRLQVEHPVTELITGLDLVRDQVLVASGQPLPYRQEDVRFRGWAIECRITAEDPYNNFLPSTGHIRTVQEPSGPGVRVDSSLYDDLEVSHYYDSLLAKVCVWGEDRAQAIQRMRRALREYVIVGVHTNLPLHQHIMEDTNFQLGRLHTAFLDQIAQSFRESSTQRERIAVLGAALLAHLKGQPKPFDAPQPVAGGRSRWATAFRPNQRVSVHPRPSRGR
ncbi:MAG TPA: acetyl-CoA carboxylase biotin carboxylase subunit [Dehalococcoidia bacterium]|nr:acetyl-CoA carboxylase biotin carboxylase subunit [Dehalococcoidia bacterium]